MKNTLLALFSDLPVNSWVASSGSIHTVTSSTATLSSTVTSTCKTVGSRSNAGRPSVASHLFAVAASATTTVSSSSEIILNRGKSRCSPLCITQCDRRSALVTGSSAPSLVLPLLDACKFCFFETSTTSAPPNCAAWMAAISSWRSWISFGLADRRPEVDADSVD